MEISLKKVPIKAVTSQEIENIRGFFIMTVKNLEAHTKVDGLK
jgi:hypothetical protein